MSEAFELMDKERTGYVSKENFRDIFKPLKLNVSKEDIERFMDAFWKDKEAGIDYKQFLRIFNRH